MPLITVHTSAAPPSEADSASLVLELSSTLARALGKPESYVMTCLAPTSRMTFAGTSEPACLVEVRSIGGLSATSARGLSDTICALIRDRLGVPTSRTYVVCADVPAPLWGFDGTTFG
ncbi:MAG: phenylpyruvate tautomerase MIF-related protein [Polyangiaceae bacterium]|jgi:phenylpyruvate tautomerase PptA (4-oxalocrotonate tautomerase family)